MTNPIYGTLIDSPAEEDLFNIKNYVGGLTSFISECKTFQFKEIGELVKPVL